MNKMRLVNWRALVSTAVIFGIVLAMPSWYWQGSNAPTPEIVRFGSLMKGFALTLCLTLGMWFCGPRRETYMARQTLLVPTVTTYVLTVLVFVLAFAFLILPYL